MPMLIVSLKRIITFLCPSVDVLYVLHLATRLALIISSILLAHHITCLADRLNLKLYMFTYRCLHNLCSPLLAGIFDTRIDSSHTAACTRSQATFGLALPKVFSRYGYYSLSFLAADRFNSLPVATRSAQSAAEFRAKCLSHIIGCPVTRPA